MPAINLRGRTWATPSNLSGRYSARAPTFNNRPIFSDAFNPDPVNTSTVVSLAEIAPDFNNCRRPAAAAALVGSTYKPCRASALSDDAISSSVTAIMLPQGLRTARNTSRTRRGVGGAEGRE